MVVSFSKCESYFKKGVHHGFCVAEFFIGILTIFPIPF